MDNDAILTKGLGRLIDTPHGSSSGTFTSIMIEK